MKHQKRLMLAAAIAAVLGHVSLAAAAETDVDMSAVPPTQTQNGISYVTGGIGQPESTAMREAGRSYDVMMTFAKQDSTFLSDVSVDISDPKGDRVLSVVSGPILLVDLPNGSYKVTASFGGKTEVRSITVGKGHERLAYTWPNSVDEGSDFAAFETLPSDSEAMPPESGMPMTPPTSSPEMQYAPEGR